MIRFSILIAFLGAFVSANAVEPPVNCYHGPVRGASVAVEGTGCAEFNCGDYDYEFDYDYLDASISKHILIGNQVKVKGDGEFYFSRHDTIKFYDSINGYVGSDKSNSEGNAYYTYQIGISANRGPQWLWVTKNNETWCSKESFYLQNPPELNVDINTTPLYRSDGTVYGTVVQLAANPYVDQYSKARVRNTNYTIKWYTRGAAGTAIDWELAGTNVNTISDTYYDGVRYFKIVLNDGEYKDIEEFHISTAEPAEGATPCTAKPWLEMCQDF